MGDTVTRGLTITENNGSYVNNWLGTGPAAWSGNTTGRGVEHFQLTNLIEFGKVKFAEFDDEDFPGGVGFMAPMEERHDTFKFVAHTQTKTEAENADRFHDLHTDTSDSTVYMFCLEPSSSYTQFTDGSRTRQDYCKGLLKKLEYVYNPHERVYEVKGLFRGMW